MQMLGSCLRVPTGLSRRALSKSNCSLTSRSFSVDAGQRGVRVLVSNTHDPFFNLATEEWLFRNGDISIPTLYLWRNEPTVVIGRCQNPWKECNIPRLKELGVHLTRRYSGGGTVYQDLGNTNFTFLSSMANHDKERNSQIIINALATMGLKAETSGRNDIMVDGFKISGAAYKLSPPRALHHGTLLIRVDMTALAGLLHPNKLKLLSKGIASVASRVKNISELAPQANHETVCSAVIDSFCQLYRHPRIDPEILDQSQLSKIEMLEKVYEEMKDDVWRFGQSPDFSHHLEGRFESPSPWGTIDVHIESKKGLIESVKVFSDSLHPDLIDTVGESLAGVAYDPAGIDAAMARTAAVAAAAAGQDKPALPDLDKHLAALGDWIKRSL